METGLALVLLKKYLRPFCEAGLYHEPNWITGKRIVTDEEYKPLLEQYEAKRELDAKMSRYRRLRHERHYTTYDQPLPDN